MTPEQIRSSVEDCPCCQAGECAFVFTRKNGGWTFEHWPEALVLAELTTKH